MLLICVGFSQNDDVMITSSWILLYTCSISSVRNNKAMIGNFRDCTPDETLTVYKNGGSKNFTQISPFEFLPMEVNFDLDSMTNIPVIKNVS